MTVHIRTYGRHLRVWHAFAHGTHSAPWYLFARGTHCRVWYYGVRILPHATHSRTWYAFARVVRILARGTHSRARYVFARGTPCSRILRIAQLGIAQQLISVRFGKCDNFPDRFGSDMQKYDSTSVGSV